jgi:hypothetical protein
MKLLVLNYPVVSSRARSNESDVLRLRASIKIGELSREKAPPSGTGGGTKLPTDGNFESWTLEEIERVQIGRNERF